MRVNLRYASLKLSKVRQPDLCCGLKNMLFVLYICAIVLTRTLGHLPEDDVNHSFMSLRFGTIPTAMLTLFELMSQPDIASYEAVLLRNYTHFLCFV